MSDTPILVRFRAIGVPNYSDVDDSSPWFPTHEEAVEYGKQLMAVGERGNWRTFQVEKWYWRDAQTAAQHPPPRARDHAHRPGGVG